MMLGHGAIPLARTPSVRMAVGLPGPAVIFLSGYEMSSVRTRPKGAPSQTQFRAWLWDRDQGKCISCGSVTKTWFADHIVPLWKVFTMRARFRLWYFFAENNGQTLCTDCHQIKTNKEAPERAHHNRLTKKRTGKTRTKHSPKIRSGGFRKDIKRCWRTGKVTRK